MENELNQTPEAQEEQQGTEVEQTTEKTEETTEGVQTSEEAPDSTDVNEEPDYKKKFSESTREAQRLLEERKADQEKLKALEEELDKLKQNDGSYKGESEEIDEFFSEYPEEERERILKFANGVTKKALSEIKKDPAIASAHQFHNEARWDGAFQKLLEQHPELKSEKEDFKAKYYKPNKDVPDNIDSLLGDMAKIYLFDKAKDLGRIEAEKNSKRIDIERSGGGDKEVKASRSLEDWNRLAQENPAQFAKLAKEFRSDMESGKI